MIPIYEPWLTDREKEYAKNAIDSGWISSKGKYIELFERAFSDYVGSKYALAVNTGTAACHLAVIAAGIKPGDEVIVPASTYIATANAVAYEGAKPVFVDVNENDWNINPDIIHEKITTFTKAIFVVHLFGNPCNMDKIMEVADKYRLVVIEDACESLSARWLDRHTGTFGKVGCFSFFGNKNVTTGEGGMVITNDRASYDIMKLYQGQGQTSQYYHPVIGFNYRMTNVEAALGLAQIERINEVIAEKRRVYHTYMELLDHDNVIVQAIPKEATHGYWMVVVLVRNAAELRIALQQQGIDSRPVFYPLNTMPPYQGGSGRYLNADKLHRYGIMLPSYPQLTDDQIQFICSIVNKHA